MKQAVSQRVILRISSGYWFPERAGNVGGMAALYELRAVLDCGGGQLTLGREAIRAFYARRVAMGRKFDFGDQRPAIIS